jgi:hypothetical protein
VWEAALHALICAPSVLAAQLDRLAGVIGMDTVELGIVPLGAALKIPAANGFWIMDDRLVIAKHWHAEIWLDDADSVATYLRVWNTLRESAVCGPDAENVIALGCGHPQPPSHLHAVVSRSRTRRRNSGG